MNDCVDAWPYIPPDLDLVGMDRYLLSSHGMDEVSGTKAYYESAIFPKLAPHQRAMIVPGLVGCSVNSSYGRSVPKEDQEQALLQKLEGYYSWAKSDPRIAGINSVSRHFGSMPLHVPSDTSLLALLQFNSGTSTTVSTAHSSA